MKSHYWKLDYAAQFFNWYLSRYFAFFAPNVWHRLSKWPPCFIPPYLERSITSASEEDGDGRKNESEAEEDFRGGLKIEKPN
jgi:hypothetical protein